MLSTGWREKLGTRLADVIFNIVPRNRVTIVQRNGQQNLWDNPFQLDFSLADHVSMSSRPEVNLRSGPILAVLIHSL